jgi:uncharacterized protein YegP (UPF0339 family)
MANAQYFFTIRLDQDGYRARFWGNYGRRLIWWTEGYSSRSEAADAISLVRRNAASAPVL